MSAVAAAVELDVRVARRLALRGQLLAGPRPRPTRAGILQVVERIGALQLDPTSVVARSHLLVLFSRLGPFDPALVDRLAYREHRLFEYWAHQASLVLADDYPLHRMHMRHRSTGLGHRRAQAREWLADNAGFRAFLLDELRTRGPLPSREIEDRSVRPWVSTGWTHERNVDRLLQFLSIEGVVLTAGRARGEKLWDLAERCLPPDVPREELSDEEISRRAAVRALRALGIGTSRDVMHYFLRGQYVELDTRLAELASDGTIVPVRVLDRGRPLRGRWWTLAETLPLAGELQRGFRGRTTLLSPFDNLICNRERTALLFGFSFTLEIYTPRDRRRYGFFVMPVVHGDRLVGRADLRVDRPAGVLRVHALHAEPGAPAAAAPAIDRALHELARFTGAEQVAYERVDAPWSDLR